MHLWLWNTGRRKSEVTQTPKDRKVKTAIRCDCCGRRLRRLDEACPDCNKADFAAQYVSSAKPRVRKVGVIEHFACSLVYFALAVFTAAASTTLVACGGKGGGFCLLYAESVMLLTIPAALLLGFIWSRIEFSSGEQSGGFSSKAASLVAVTAVLSSVIASTAFRS